MAKFSKELRQKIIEEFCRKRNSDFDARLFEKDVRDTGPDHPAYEWFEWDSTKAAEEYRIWQAREFAQGLRVKFSVEEVGRAGVIRVREVSAPFLVSPMDGRRDGGGYFITDPNSDEHMSELCRQAATDLNRWLRRYQAALVHAGGSIAIVEKQIALLEKVAASVDEAA